MSQVARVVQYSDKFMRGIVLHYIHLTIQYNREQSNTIDCNALPCINLSEYWTILQVAHQTGAFLLFL